MTATLTPTPIFQWIGTNGQPLVGGLLYSYAAGTSTPLATYTDATGSTANPNPIVLDAAGSAAIWLGSANYKLVLTDTFSNVLWTSDNINAVQNVALASTGGTIYQPGSSTTLNINADPGLFPQIILQLAGTNSALLTSKTQGDLTIGGFAANGTYLGDIWTFDLTTSSYSGTNFIIGANTTSNPTVSVNGAAGTGRSYLFLTSGSNRWQIGANPGPESGSNSGSDWAFQSYADNGAFLRTVAVCTRSTGAWNFNVSVTSPSITDSSDRRKKKNIKDFSLKEAWRIISGLRPRWFKWRGSNLWKFGLIAQEAKVVCPEVVEQDEDGYYSIAYQKLVAPLILIVKDQEKRILELERRIKDDA